MPITVVVPGFEGLIQINGVAGASSVVDLRLTGSFQLVIDGVTSDESTIGSGGAPPEVVVRQLSADSYVTVSHLSWDFMFPEDGFPAYYWNDGSAAPLVQGHLREETRHFGLCPGRDQELAARSRHDGEREDRQLGCTQSPEASDRRRDGSLSAGSTSALSAHQRD